jgi:hypothetical protein
VRPSAGRAILFVEETTVPDTVMPPAQTYRKHLGVVLLLAAVLLMGCGGKPVTAPPAGEPRISIHTVQVDSAGQPGIFTGGETTLPDGECIKTELIAGDTALEWWPRDFCAQAQGGRWGLHIPQELNGTAVQLAPGVQYTLRAWWPGSPEETLARFTFDLDGPPTPGSQPGGD